MTTRVVVAVALAVALLSVAAPGMQAAREHRAASAVETDARSLAVAVADVADAPPGTRRVVAFEVPGASAGSARVDGVVVHEHAVRYRLASGARGSVVLPAAVSFPAGVASAAATRGVVLSLTAPGSYVLVVRRTAAGVVVERVGVATVARDRARRSRGRLASVYPR